MFKKNKNIIFALPLMLAAVAVVAFFASRDLYNNSQIKNSPKTELGSHHLVKPEDRQPLKISQETINQGKTVKVPILMYHHIGDPPGKASPMRKDLTVSTADFEQEVKWLGENNYTSIRLEDIFLYSQNKFTMPKKPVVFTFDDGYDDVFLNAIPVLKKYGFIGSFAIITQYPKMQNGDNFYASWEEIAKALQDGNEIVSHTQNHFDGKNPKYSQNFISQNLSGSVNDIQGHLGFAPRILIYPYGHYTPEYIKLAKQAGFVMGVTVHEGSLINLNDLMQTPRLRVHGNEALERFQRLITK